MSIPEIKLSNHRFSEHSGAHIFAESLQRHGVTHIFGQSIPSALHLVAPEYGIRQVAYRTENAGTVMADGYARVSNTVPVVTCQNGPAATLLVPGLAEALKASIPIVAIVQDVHSKQTDRNAFQELDHLALFQGCAKWIRRVSEPSRIADYVDMAFTAAASGRPGPAVLIAPIDLFENPIGQEIPYLDRGRTKNLGKFPLDRPTANREEVKRAAEMLAKAKRPLIIAGGGVHTSGAASVLAQMQDIAHLPVATTSMGKGTIDEGHELSVGVVGYFMGKGGMSRYNRALVSDADVILLVGNRTNQNGTDSWKLYPTGAKYIQIDIDGQEIGRNYEAEVRLVGDARETLKALIEALGEQDLSIRKNERRLVASTIAEGKSKHKAEAADFTAASASPIRPERVMAELDKIIDADSIVVADASYSSIWITNYLRSRRPGMRFLTPRGLAGLGWGLPMAMGAHMAKPEARLFCLSGDGGFGHVWSELETARRMGMSLTLIVLNNSILGYQEHAEDLLYGDHTDACRFVGVDHAAIARAVGIEGLRIEKVEQLGPALAAAANRRSVTLLDVITDDKAFPPVTMFDGKY
ncbi:acetolactate synthase catalytic subunit [Phyllobacterium sp. SB3]|uniref:acetolactate synthase catalytic subunit n=1 Tax=Phyllobacterium sp. SB3 TaxID=3156073 RepID=UPI0032AEDA99